MKVIAIVAVTLTLLGASSAGDDEKAKTMEIWKCFQCHEDPAALEDYIKCKELKPERGEQMILDCRDKIMPGLETIYDRFPVFCKNENNERERFYDCLMSHENKKIMDEAEKSKMEEYEQCSNKVKAKYCGSYM